MRSGSVVIPLYYCDHSLYKVISDCLKSIKEHYPSLSVIVIDDASPLDHDFPVTVRNAVNLGYTATVNKGIKLAGDTFIVCNDDVVIKAGDFDHFSSMEGLGIWVVQDSAGTPDDTFGCCWGTTKETIEKVGYLNEEYKHYFSDRDYYERVKALDIPIYKDFSTVIEHKESATYSKVSKDLLFETDKQAFSKRLLK